jgi:hypothetical protein
MLLPRAPCFHHRHKCVIALCNQMAENVSKENSQEDNKYHEME